jgi:hypothetical protein
LGSSLSSFSATFFSSFKLLSCLLGTRPIEFFFLREL